MKSKLIGLLLLISVACFGQSVPNTTTFTLQNVVDVVNPTTDDLQDCFNDANADYFNDTHSGAKNSLLNFRDYGPHNAVCTAVPDITQLAFPGYATSSVIRVQTSVLSSCAITSRVIYYSKTYPATESSSSFPQANTAGTIASDVSGLQANTGYYFSFYTYNALGKDSIIGNFKQFTTP